MKEFWDRNKAAISKVDFMMIIKQVVFFFLGLLVLIIVSAGILALYFEANKTKISTQINSKINENISGTVTIGNINYKFLKGFPNMTLALSQVELRDSLWANHKRTLLKAQQIEVRINVIDLIVNEINIDKIEIQNATLYLFKGKNGLSNTNIFRSKESGQKTESATTSTIHLINLKQVHFISENLIGKKLFNFDNIDLRATINHINDDWNTVVYLKTFAKSMTFNTKHGSFIKDQKVEGMLAANFSATKNQISVTTEKLSIGKDFFDINAKFSLNEHKSPFKIAIKTNILWKNAAALMSDNIYIKVNQFDFKDPITVGCIIDGDMSATEDPKITVSTKSIDNELTIPDGLITDCFFDAKFTNHYKKGAGCNDINSGIIITKFKGKYKTIPFAIPLGKILNFEATIASGSFNSDFDVAKLNKIISKNLMHFTTGQAKMNMDFRFSIVDLKIEKPYFIGKVMVQDAVASYGPRNLSFVRSNVQLDFTEKALLIKKINLKDNESNVFIEGKIDNFLNLYYENPSLIVIDWDIYAPFIDVKKLVANFTNPNKTQINQKDSENDISEELFSAIKKSQVVINVKADKMVYGKLEASDAKVLILLQNNELIVKNGVVKSADGKVTFQGKLTPQGEGFVLKSDTKIENVDIAKFLASLNNFGITSFTPANLKGFLTASASVEGKLLAGGELKTNSLLGKATVKVSQGKLIEFKPITNIAKFALPFRDVNNIVFRDLSGNFIIRGEAITVNNLKVSSNILNLDINGVYSFGRGTNLALTIPLRNPKKDQLIVDKEQRAEKRLDGIVLHLLAIDDEGEIKIRWNKNHK
ncbi:small nuclear ribonucleoprotein (snRNP)-like protein [Flavobacterium sp. PL11]|uniref:AsmA-like C-terminal region-containing protein n=1 Tax=Flavobacterium sp. PL11 TaxID=3071717 RepID=UPI002E0511D4|nr:small nuclear ribonucleoprotein (snRNP)-like protein [Flavobacterium sp. PL11]